MSWTVLCRTSLESMESIKVWQDLERKAMFVEPIVQYDLRYTIKKKNPTGIRSKKEWSDLGTRKRFCLFSSCMSNVNDVKRNRSIVLYRVWWFHYNTWDVTSWRCDALLVIFCFFVFVLVFVSWVIRYFKSWRHDNVRDLWAFFTVWYIYYLYFKKILMTSCWQTRSL